MRSKCKKIKCAGVFFIFLNFGVVFSQNVSNINFFDGQYFRSPVDYVFSQSGNFCELRETHFHTGIDIKPKGSRVPIKTIGSGHISRIKVSSGGYGKVLYIDHPESGYTSVYAHLEEFNDPIKAVVSQYQKASENYEVDFNLNSEVISVNKGEQIGIMGNTGFSFGTHLHFEIRDTKSEKPINPMHFGIKTPDSTSPSLISLAIHGLDPDFYKIWEKRISLIHTKDNHIYFTEPIQVPAFRVGVALNMFDRSDLSRNKQGIYGFHMYVDDMLEYSYHMDKISFDQVRYITGFYDYKIKKTEKTTFALCYKLPGNDLAFLNDTGNGIIPVFQEKERKVRIEIEDFNKNRKTLHFSLLRSPDIIKEYTSIDTLLMKIKVGDSVQISEKNLIIAFEPNSLFRNIQLKITKSESKGNETKYSIHDMYEPIKKPVKIFLKPEYPINDKMEKAIIVKTNGNGSGKINFGGRRVNGIIWTEMTEFGTFFIDFDTIAPTISSINFTPNFGKKTTLRFSVKDNFPTKGIMVEDLRIKVWIDGNFVISPYTSRTQILEVPLNNLANGSHILKIEVKDHSDNTAYFTSDFVVKK